MQLTLFYAPSTCSLVPYVLLTEAGAPFDVQPINLMAGEQLRPEFLRLYPKHKVPVLLRDGVALTETIAIQLWIARTFPEAQLLPSDPEEEIQAIALSAWCASGIHPALTPNALPHRYCDLPDSAESVRRCAHKLLHEAYAIMEERLTGREWLFARLSCPDVHFFWSFRRGMQFGVDQSRYVACRAHFDRMMQRPSVQKLMAFEAQTLEQFNRAKAQ